MSTLQESKDKAMWSSLLLMAVATHAGDRERFDLGRAGLAHVGAPGGEGAPTIDEAMSAIKEADCV